MPNIDPADRCGCWLASSASRLHDRLRQLEDGGVPALLHLLAELEGGEINDDGYTLSVEDLVEAVAAPVLALVANLPARPASPRCTRTAPGKPPRGSPRRSGQHPEVDLVFRRLDGGPIHAPTIKKILAAACDPAGVARITPHQFARHGAATLLRAQGASLEEIRGLLRHARISTTADIYAHVPDELRRGTADRMDALLCAIDPLWTPPRGISQVRCVS